MTSRSRALIRFLVFLFLGIAFGWLAFAGQDLEEMALLLGRTRWAYVVLALAITFLGHWARATRWKLLLRGSGSEVRTCDALISLLNGYFVNLGVPRLGEVTRCGVLNRLSGAPVLGIAGTVVAERAVDVAVLLLICLSFFFTAGEEILTVFRDRILDPLAGFLHSKALVLMVIACVGLLGLGVLFWLSRRRSQAGAQGFIGRYASQLWHGLLSALRIRGALGFILLTLAIWISYFSAPLLSLYALDLAGPNVLTVAFAVFLFGSLARTVPLPAGSAGAYHYLVSAVMLVWGYSEGEGLGLATLNHGVQTLFYLLAGLGSWAALVWLQRKGLTHSPNPA